VVNAGGSPGEEVINRRRSEFGDEYRSVTDGPHPVAGLREDGRHEGLGYGPAGTRTPNLQEA
jgi:hypothetical protein